MPSVPAFRGVGEDRQYSFTAKQASTKVAVTLAWFCKHNGPFVCAYAQLVPIGQLKILKTPHGNPPHCAVWCMNVFTWLEVES